MDHLTEGSSIKGKKSLCKNSNEASTLHASFLHGGKGPSEFWRSTDDAIFVHKFYDWKNTALWRYISFYVCRMLCVCERVYKKELWNTKRMCRISHWFFRLQLVFRLFLFFILGAWQQAPVLNTFASFHLLLPFLQKSVNILFGFLTSLHNSCLTSWLVRVT